MLTDAEEAVPVLFGGHGLHFGANSRWLHTHRPFSEDGDDFMHKLQIIKRARCYLFKVALLFVLRLCPSFILLAITELLFSKNMK